VSLPAEPVWINADLTRMAQVFANLLNNSAKYTERGGRIWFTAEKQGDELVATVKDTGIGIAPDQLSNIFNMFSQVEGSLERAQGGLGIGLTLVKRLVEMHGGTVEARSEGPRAGAEVIVRLPALGDGEPPDGVAKNGEAAAPKSSLKILIVDDNRDGAQSLSALLRLLGNETQTAFDGQQGIDMAEEFRPDVVLLDIGLPKLNGYEACQRIRERDWGRQATLIAVTGWGQDNDRRRSEDAGFDHHLTKPVMLPDLMNLLSGL
jgi:CheY-like chemotaxis protein